MERGSQAPVWVQNVSCAARSRAWRGAPTPALLWLLPSLHNGAVKPAPPPTRGQWEELVSPLGGSALSLAVLQATGRPASREDGRPSHGSRLPSRAAGEGGGRVGVRS